MSLSTQYAISQSWWAQNSNTTEKLQDVNFSNDNTGFMFGDTLSTFVSTNTAGASWTDNTMLFTLSNLRSSAVINSSTIFTAGVYDVVGGKGIVMATGNGGASWAVDSSFTEDLFDIDFPSSTIGYVSGENGYIAKTTDSGNNWIDLNSGTGEDIFDMHFISNDEGWAVGTVDANAIVIHTNDGGTTWTLQTSGIVEPLNAVDFIDNMNGWAVGAAGSIINTTDGGANWTTQNSTTAEDLFDIDMLDANHGWAVGGGGTVLKTSDGGTTWATETSGTGSDILSIHMRDTTLGWFCGDGGVVRIYAENPPTVGVEEIESEIGITAYPNPFNDNVKIEVPFENSWSYKIYDVTGKIVAEEGNLFLNQIDLDLKDLESGPYILICSEVTGKILIDRLICQ